MVISTLKIPTFFPKVYHVKQQLKLLQYPIVKPVVIQTTESILLLKNGILGHHIQCHLIIAKHPR